MTESTITPALAILKPGEMREITQETKQTIIDAANAAGQSIYDYVTRNPRYSGYSTDVIIGNNYETRDQTLYPDLNTFKDNTALLIAATDMAIEKVAKKGGYTELKESGDPNADANLLKGKTILALTRSCSYVTADAKAFATPEAGKPVEGGEVAYYRLESVRDREVMNNKMMSPGVNFESNGLTINKVPLRGSEIIITPVSDEVRTQVGFKHVQPSPIHRVFYADEKPYLRAQMTHLVKGAANTMRLNVEQDLRTKVLQPVTKP